MIPRAIRGMLKDAKGCEQKLIDTVGYARIRRDSEGYSGMLRDTKGC